ncbi:hypothetical protein C1H46_008063 [Malus baccata]|uniref:Uncharacterized protein n=1 Tax=Malus baccata TaxID=106549 RepID=A0A540N5H9_MALBA|nr:hypothetical protein C1H46_008063 [Malus baccata]
MTVGELMRIQMGISEGNVSEVLDDDDFVIVGDVDIGEGKQSENDEPGSGELRKKKRKIEKVAGELKGEKRLKKSAKAKDDAELNGEKDVGEKKLKRSLKAGEEDGATVNHKKDGLSLKEKKKDGTRKKADDSSARGEESIGKKEKRKSKESVGKKEKRKSEDEKLKSTEANLKKAKRSKKAAE